MFLGDPPDGRGRGAAIQPEGERAVAEEPGIVEGLPFGGQGIVRGDGGEFFPGELVEAC